MKEKHLKLFLSDNEGRRFEAVWWDGVARSNGRTFSDRKSIEVAYTLEAKLIGVTRSTFAAAEAVRNGEKIVLR
jgi:hypothetical protein